MSQIAIPSSGHIDIDNTSDDPRERPPLVLGGKDFTRLTDSVAHVAERKTTLGWKIGFAISLSLLGTLGICLGYLITTGVGVWGNNQPCSWAFDIVNFVFWVGIGHAGTLISAILFLFRQNWRTGINRFAEAMTIFAVVCAGLFPGIHVRDGVVALLVRRDDPGSGDPSRSRHQPRQADRLRHLLGWLDGVVPPLAS